MNTSRRSLLKKIYVAPAVIALGSMVLTTNVNGASSLSKKGNNGWGNGDQSAPGNSLNNNNAENNKANNPHKIHGEANSN